MDTQFIATVYGPERSGIMKCLADETHRLGGIWLDSRMSQLDGQFIGLIKVEIPEDNEQQLKSFFQQQENISTHFNPVSTISSDAKILTINFDAKDRAGLVSDISGLLSNAMIDIDKVEVHRVALSDIGSSMFTSLFTLRAPSSCNLQQLEADLKAIEPGASIKISA